MVGRSRHRRGYEGNGGGTAVEPILPPIDQIIVGHRRGSRRSSNAIEP